jgi:putative hydroxymethylpyrimidine transporter CytX
MKTAEATGIEPVAPSARALGLWDFVVLWGDLGIGLLVLLAGSFLVPALSLGQALAAIVVGSVIGVLLLALTAVIGSRTGVPTMVCLRPALGRLGSYAPTALNVVQLLGWTVFELVIMGYAANSVSRAVLGLDAYWMWMTVFAAVVVGMGVWGPLGVVRQWLGRFAVWVMLATTIWLTWRLVHRYDVGALLGQPGTGGLGFWGAVDIAIAMPISWLPLVCDYSRFARRPPAAFWGTGLGYLVANVWFYGLGAVILLAARVSQEPRGFVEAIALLAGPLVLLILLVDETDEAWADLYSCAVSIQNAFPAAPLRPLVAGLGALAWLAALALDVTQYELFLLWIGSVFVPLFGVLATDHFLVRGRYEPGEFFPPPGLAGHRGGVNWLGVTAWAAGILVYRWAAGSFAGLGLPAWAVGASIPSLLAAGLVYLILTRLGPRRLAGPARP